MIAGHHSEVSKTADIFQATFIAEVEDGFGEFNSQSFSATSMAAVLVTPVDCQKHVVRVVLYTPHWEYLLGVAKVLAVGRLRSHVQRIRMFDALALFQVFCKPFDPSEGGGSDIFDQHCYLRA